jgi:hypothetical protein
MPHQLTPSNRAIPADSLKIKFWKHVVRSAPATRASSRGRICSRNVPLVAHVDACTVVEIYVQYVAFCRGSNYTSYSFFCDVFGPLGARVRARPTAALAVDPPDEFRSSA